MDTERKYHRMGSAGTEWGEQSKRITIINPLDNQLEQTFANLSDEFLNEYIPNNFELPVTWRDILLCGMIPEHRLHQSTKNQFIRKDIHYDKIEMNIPEEPSPAPIPEPGTPPENIIKVNDHIPNIISCTKKDESIEIILMNNEKYITTIKSSDKSWIEEYSKYFQDFNRFYEALNKTFTETNFYVKWSIKDKTTEMVIVQISCDDELFGFKVDISIGREQNQIDILESRVKVLEETEEKYHILEEKVQTLMEIIHIIGIGNPKVRELLGITDELVGPVEF